MILSSQNQLVSDASEQPMQLTRRVLRLRSCRRHCWTAAAWLPMSLQHTHLALSFPSHMQKLPCVKPKAQKSAQQLTSTMPVGHAQNPWVCM